MNQSNRSSRGFTDLDFPVVSLGAMSLDIKEKKQNASILDIARENGINYIDTADLYDQGKNEKLIGELIQQDRSKWTVASKVGNRWLKDFSGWEWAASKKYILAAVESSLKNLHTDYLDLYQLHGGMIEDPMDEIIEAFELLVEQGKIRTYGISSIRPNVFKYYLSNSNIRSNMMQFSLLDRRPIEYLADFESSNVAVIARGAVSQGLLLDKGARDYLGTSAKQVQELNEIIEQMANELEVSKLAVVLNYPLCYKAVKSVVVGVRNVSQMEELVEAIPDFDKIDSDDYIDLLSELPSIKYTNHR